MPFDLPLALAQAAPLQPIPISEQQIQQVIDFVLRRLEQVLVDRGTSVEAVRAVLRQRGNSPALAAESAQQLQVGLSMLPNYALLFRPPIELKRHTLFLEEDVPERCYMQWLDPHA